MCVSAVGLRGRRHSQTRRPQGVLQGPLCTEDTLSSAGQCFQHATQLGRRHPGPGPRLNLLRPHSRKAGNSHTCALPLGNKRANPDLLSREGRAPPRPVHFLLSRARRWLPAPAPSCTFTRRYGLSSTCSRESAPSKHESVRGPQGSCSGGAGLGVR